MKPELIEIVKEEVDKIIDVLDEVIRTDIEPLLPQGIEKTVGKKYEDWDEKDFQLAQAAFGQKLESFIANKEVKSLRELESTEV